MAFGTHRDEEGDNRANIQQPEEAFHGSTIGGIVGVDTIVATDLRAGAFVGGAEGESEIVDRGYDDQEVDAESVFGGFFLRYGLGATSIDFILSAGQTDFDTRRVVYNNLAANGVEIAEGSFDGTFISPELALTTTLNVGGVMLKPSVRARYASISLDAYAETGSQQNLTISERDVDVFVGRAQIAAPITVGTAAFAPRIGVEFVSSDDDEIAGTMLGEAFTFSAGDDDDNATGFVGSTLDVSLGAGTVLFADGEVHFGEETVDRAEARAGVKVRF